MSKVLPFVRMRVSIAEQIDHAHTECAHGRVEAQPNGRGAVCLLCGMTLSPLRALSTLSERYEVALAQIERLKERLALVDARVLELSEELDALVSSERASKEPPNTT